MAHAAAKELDLGKVLGVGSEVPETEDDAEAEETDEEISPEFRAAFEEYEAAEDLEERLGAFKRAIMACMGTDY